MASENEEQTVGGGLCSLGFCVMGILALVFAHHTYEDFPNDTSFEHDPYAYFMTWGIVMLIPPAYFVLHGFLNNPCIDSILGAAMFFGVFAALGCWIWGFVILDSSDGSHLKHDYFRLWALAVSYQVLYGVGLAVLIVFVWCLKMIDSNA